MNTVEALARGCLERLREALGPGTALRLERSPRPEWDYYLHIGARPAGRLPVEVKPRIATRTQALHCILLMRHRAAERTDAVVFSEWVPEPAAEEFRTAGIGYVDAAGNAFLRKPPHLLVDIRGRRPERAGRAEPGRLIEPSGLKVAHYLLTHPEAVSRPLRRIAEGANVSLGTAHLVVRELARAQWLLPGRGRTRRYGDRTGLIDLFVRGYALKLRPSWLIGRYRHRLRNPDHILDAFAARLAAGKGQWAATGAVAAGVLTRHLKPDSVSVLVDEAGRAALAAEPMLRDPVAGNVTILDLFAAHAVDARREGPWPMATPLLIYAELLHEAGPREIETARILYEQFIEPEPQHASRSP